MQFILTIDIPDSEVLKSAQEYVKQAFRVPEWNGDKGGEMHKIVQEQTRTELLQMDFRPLIRQTAQALAEEAVRETVLAELKAQAKKAVKQMALDGSLLKE